LLGFCKTGWWGHLCHRNLSTCVIGNVFKPFVILFMPKLAALSCCAQFPKRLAHGGSPGTKQLPQTASLFVRRDRGSLQIWLEIASVNIPHRIRASRLPPRALAVTSQERGTAHEGLGSVTIASEVAIPTGHGRKPIL
jgi:hypothetical protein